MRIKTALENHVYTLIFLINLCSALIFRLRHLVVERMWPDEALYAWLGQRIWQNPTLIFSKEATAFHPPLFPFFLSLGHFLLPSPLACRFIVLVFNLAGIVLIYFLGKKISGPFVGLLASIFLANNYLYFGQANLILVDGVLTVAYIAFALLLLNITPKTGKREDLIVGLMGSFFILLKWYAGILMIPMLLGYYLFALKEIPLRQRMRKMALPLTLYAIPTAAILMTKITAITTVFHGQYFVQPFWFYISNLRFLIGIPYIFPLYIIGLYSLLKQERRKTVLLLSWIIPLFIILSIISEKTFRYILPSVPCLLIISSLGVDHILSRLFRSPRIKTARVLTTVICLFSCLSLYPKTETALKKDGTGYAGFQEAGTWIRNHTDPHAIIMAGSRRAIRYASGINYKEFGGKIISIPKDKKDFARIVTESNGRIILETDIWEFTQPKWIYPMTGETKKFLDGLNFKMGRVVYRPAQNKLDQPVIRIFKMEPKN